MTQKDYRLIAEAMLEARPTAKASRERKESWCMAVNCIAQRLRGDNPKFHRHVFVSHCGMNNGWYEYEDRGSA